MRILIQKYKNPINLHVVYALAAKKSKRFVQQLFRKRIIVLVASPSGLIKHAFSKSMMSAERYYINITLYYLILLCAILTRNKRKNRDNNK